MSSSKFVVIVPFAPSVSQTALTQLAIQSGWGWWHWGTDTWLLTAAESLDAVQLREKISAIVPGIKFIVVKVQPSKEGANWAALGPVTWGHWFTEAWEKRNAL